MASQKGVITFLFFNAINRASLNEDSFRAKWNIFISVSGQFLITVYIKQPKHQTHEIPLGETLYMKLIAGVISLRLFWQKWNFIPGDKISCKHYLKWNHIEGNICTCVNKNDWLLSNGLFIPDQLWNEIHFILPAMKINANRISFMMGWNFFLGRFHYGSHGNSLLDSSISL